MRVALQPCGDAVARGNFKRTIEQPIPASRIQPFLDASQRAAFAAACGSRSAIWGVSRGRSGVKPQRWQKLQPGDYALFYRDWKFFLQARITLTMQNAALAQDLWGLDADGQPFEYLYFLDGVQGIDLSWSALREAVRLPPTDSPLRSFDVLDADKTQPVFAALNKVSGQEAGDVGWSEVELRTSVETYFDMARRIRAGEPVVKVHVLRHLAEKFGRTEKAFEYRMRNISYVLALHGRDWITGLAPAQNVGTNVGPIIERLIAEVEGKPLVARVADEIALVAAKRMQLKAPPQGRSKPAQSNARVSVYERDIDVKIWVLKRAKGNCEACNQPAPFARPDEEPFLEVHHVRHLADGGSDTVTNAVALCPNCHRRLHYGSDAKAYRDSLYGLVGELVRE